MNITEQILVEALEGKPLGETNNFIWYITEIGILALEKETKSLDKFPEKEALEINLDLEKEEREYYYINQKNLILYYS